MDKTKFVLANLSIKYIIHERNMVGAIAGFLLKKLVVQLLYVRA